MTESNGTDTEPSELAPDSSRDTLPPPALDLQIAELQAALGEQNVRFLQFTEAATRSSNLCLQLLQRLQTDEAVTAWVDRRVARLEAHFGFDPEPRPSPARVLHVSPEGL